MLHYGLNMQGTFTIEVVPYLKDFTIEDTGRFIYVTTNDNYYFGTAIDWIQVGLTPKCIKVEHLDFGFLYNQINAKFIPFEDSFLKSKNVSDTLKALSSGGSSFKPNSILAIHLSEKCVNLNNMNFGILNTQISAKDIPFRSLLTTDVTDIQTSIQKLERQYIQIIRSKILKTNWDYDFDSQTYVGHVSTSLILNKYIIVQCYDENNNMIFPKKVYLDTYYNRVYIYHTINIDVNVVILG